MSVGLQLFGVLSGRIATPSEATVIWTFDSYTKGERGSWFRKIRVDKTESFSQC